MESKKETLYEHRLAERAKLFDPQYRPEATRSQWEDFAASAVWRDMLDWLDTRREMNRGKLEGATDLTDIYRLQGECNAFGQLLMFVDQALEALDVEEEEDERRSRTDS